MKLICALLLVGPAFAAKCKEECLHERGQRHAMLERCLKDARRGPAQEVAKARLACRRSSVLPRCDGLPPCPADEAPADEGIDVVSHLFARGAEGPPVAEAHFRPGETVFLRYQVAVLPEPAAREIQLVADVVLRAPDGKVVRRVERALAVTQRLGPDDIATPHLFKASAEVDLPDDLPPGEYVFEIRLRDAASRIEATRGFRFAVAK